MNVAVAVGRCLLLDWMFIVGPSVTKGACLLELELCAPIPLCSCYQLHGHPDAGQWGLLNLLSMRLNTPQTSFDHVTNSIIRTGVFYLLYFVFFFFCFFFMIFFLFLDPSAS